MTQSEMYEQSFRRPTNFFQLTPMEQWAIDKSLGILDWDGDGLSHEQIARFDAYYTQATK
jgi:hypothetical protein